MRGKGHRVASSPPTTSANSNTPPKTRRALAQHTDRNSNSNSNSSKQHRFHCIERLHIHCTTMLAQGDRLEGDTSTLASGRRLLVGRVERLGGRDVPNVRQGCRVRGRPLTHGEVVTINNNTGLYESGNWNEYNLNPLTRIHWRASLVPAAAVIPAPIAWTLGWAGRSASGVHRSSRPFCRRCAPGLNWPGRASGAVTLKKLECSKQAYALYTLAWDNIIGFRSYYVGLRDRTFAKDVFINQERKLGARRRSDTVLVSTINDADQGSADVAFRTPPAPYEKSKSLGSGGSMVARLKLKGIDGRAPPGVEPAA
ncbi:UNVERIFIED_CONTAM: hypothetical protein Sindi_3099000 [Sesamum indicum]